MTTFKNNSKYAELLFLYLDVAYRPEAPLTCKEVLDTFIWNFKGGDLEAVAKATELKPETSGAVYPEGSSSSISQDWPDGLQALALRRILAERSASRRMKHRAMLSRVSTYRILTSDYGLLQVRPRVFIGMKSIYHIFGQIWEWAGTTKETFDHSLLQSYTRELALSMSAVSKMHLPTVDLCQKDFFSLLGKSRVGPLLVAIRQIKDLIRLAGSGQARALARMDGAQLFGEWENKFPIPDLREVELADHGDQTRFLQATVAGLRLRVGQWVALLGLGEVRYAMGQSDMERLHQLVMSAASCLVGVCSQAAVGTPVQKMMAAKAVEVTERNVGRIVQSSRLVPLGDEVLVCKGYRRAYTAHLGYLAGPLCLSETLTLVQEAMDTAPPGVLDVTGFLSDARGLDAASSLNASKTFKICPAPDVSPGAALIDRVKQIGNGNKVVPEMMVQFEDELRSQILRAYIRHRKTRLPLRSQQAIPIWHSQYVSGNYDMVPSGEIHQFLAWEGTATMPDISPFDPSNWKDSGLGADTIEESELSSNLGHKNNMLTRLIFDTDCPMPGTLKMSSEHVIKFFMKAEGHKDPARGIFSANLIDRQAQSWMERAVDQVAREHPSFMIGQEMDDRIAKVGQLTSRPKKAGILALYYSFDISGWSAKMPAEPQRISHAIWAALYGGHLFARATEVNEGAHIYLNLEGYKGWFKNTHANLEGFNGKEMTMLLVALLSLSVRRWRAKVVEKELMEERDVNRVSALLFAYIDDGLSRIDLPSEGAMVLFNLYKETVIETFSMCGFSVEVSKCFPSDRFAIFLNEVYLAGRHVVHGVRAAMGISAEPTERHTSLVERVSSVSSGVRGAVIAGLNPLSASFLMAYHVLMHLEEWVAERDPVILACWSICPRAWGGLGLPNLLQLFASGSGSAFEESVATMQAYGRVNATARSLFLKLTRLALAERDPVGVLTAPLSGRVIEGYMVDSRVAVAVRRSLQWHMKEGKLSKYAKRLLSYSDRTMFEEFATSIVPMDPHEVLQEQMLINLSESHPHTVFSDFARRLEKATTLRHIVGQKMFNQVITDNRNEARSSVGVFKRLLVW